MIQKDVTYCGALVTIACDAQCHKAWGRHGRPRSPVEPDPKEIALRMMADPRGVVSEPPNPDDWFYYADHELGFAPKEVGTWEGESTKPKTRDERLNKWCCRECERCTMVPRGEPIVLRDFDQRVYNIPREKT
jgi:hypothetical protein